MKILLHGATNWESSNFGDYLYGEIFYEFLSKLLVGSKISFYDTSDFFKNNIREYRGCIETRKIKEVDCLVYIPGGYFEEAHNARLRDNLVHFIRFMPVGLKCALFRKHIVIIGVGAGENRNGLLKIAIRAICKHSRLITVRDEQSKTALELLGINSVIVGADPLLAKRLDAKEEVTEQINSIVERAKNKKILFVHYNHSELAMEMFGKTIKKFLEVNSEYVIVVGSDQILKNEEVMYEKFCEYVEERCMFYKYNSAHELIALLNRVDTILTCKLHVGVVSAMFAKSVICAAVHPEKTIRFYERINNRERCVSLYETNEEELLFLLNKFLDTKIKISKDEINKAKVHYQKMQLFFDNLEK